MNILSLLDILGRSAQCLILPIQKPVSLDIKAHGVKLLKRGALANVRICTMVVFHGQFFLGALCNADFF
jgi:hypothetical protein